MRVEMRKLQRLGTSSLVVTLPKEWVRRHGLKAGDSVYVIDMGDELRIGVVAEKPSTLTLDTKGMSVKDIVRSLTCLYVMGFTGAELKLESLSVVELSKLKESLKRFPGFEVVSEDENSLQVSYVADPDKFDLRLIVKSMGITVARIADLLSSIADGRVEPGEAREAIDSIRSELLRSQHVAMRNLVGRIAKGESIAYAVLMGTGLLGLIGDLLLSIAEQYVGSNGFPGSEKVAELVHQVAEKVPMLASALVSPSRRKAKEVLDWVAELAERARKLASECGDPVCARVVAKLEDAIRVMQIVANIAYCGGFVAETVAGSQPSNGVQRQAIAQAHA